MLGLFTRKKNAGELVKLTKEALMDPKKDIKEVTKRLVQMKELLYGTGEKPVEPSPEQVAQLSVEFVNNNLIALLLTNMQKIEFEAKKLVSQILNNILQKSVNDRFIVADYFKQQPELLSVLANSYDLPLEISLPCGSILRECIRHEELASLFLASEDFFKLFDYIDVANFDQASDAFVTFSDLLTKHKSLVAEFLDKNYDQVMTRFLELLKSANYVTKRQSLKLLGEILLSRSNFNIMNRFISSVDNLKMMMNLLRDEARNIQLEAFHVFKVFVANPSKPTAVRDILLKNSAKLIQYLKQFCPEKAEDDTFQEDKQLLIDEITRLSHEDAMA
eukprot:TRINITY_DN4030_c0_g1_i1.p1 TRINITY_DN4030_c0_g1~~TRINITY_DN4030_c0_g1_i1.p1  ORF type:complete len:333 (+),score=89.98 TRINITY_DN4030_c0_g1_i1:39-1037(+)